MQHTCLMPKDFGPLTQTGQEHPTLFAFAKKEGDTIFQLHPFVLCRDYLLDGVMWTKHPETYHGKVYGFPKIEEISLDKVELIVGESAQLAHNLHVLNKMEEELNISKTTLTPLSRSGAYYVLGDAWWYKSPIHLSTYSLILRTLGYIPGIVTWAHLEKTLANSYSSLRGKLLPVLKSLHESKFESFLVCVPDRYKLTDTTSREIVHSSMGVYTFDYYVTKLRQWDKFRFNPLAHVYIKHVDKHV